MMEAVITERGPPPPAPDTVGTIPGVEETKMEQVAVELPPSPPMAQAPQAASPAPRRPAPQQHALKPARAARPLPVPELDVGLLRRLELAARPGGRPRSYDVLTSPESNLVCMFVRSLKKAIYGEVWDALEIELVEVDGVPRRFNVLRDEAGRDRRLAVKRMPWDKINHYRKALKEDPLQEISALSIMSEPGHPNVLQKVAALDDGKTVYLITPFVDGGELFDWIAESGSAPENVVRRMFRQIVDGMKYMHERGICHADMSLENCLVDTARANAFIIDFGMCVAMPMDEHGRRFMSVPDKRRAKPSYCSPEAFKEKEYDGVKVDVFAAGAMLFMMLTGFPPFQSATRVDNHFRRLVWNGDVQGLLRSFRAPPMDNKAADLVRRMMAYKAEDRPLPEQVLAHEWMNAAPAAV